MQTEATSSKLATIRTVELQTQPGCVAPSILIAPVERRDYISSTFEEAIAQAVCGGGRHVLRKLEIIESELAHVLSSQSNLQRRVVSLPARDSGGFDIEIIADTSGLSVSFGGLLHEFALVADAMLWVRRAMSDAYHLRIVSVGGKLREWRLEPVAGPGAESPPPAECLAAGHAVLFSHMRQKTIFYRRNAVLPAALAV
jgi:hypothetical protein